MGKPYAKEGPSAEDKALDLFADMMILCWRQHKIIYVWHRIMLGISLNN